MNLNDYDRKTLETMLDNAKKQQTAVSETYDPDGGKHAEMDIALIEPALIAVDTLRNIAGKLGTPGVLGNNGLQNAIAGIDSEFNHAREKAETRLREWQGMKAHKENMPNEVQRIETALKERGKLESKLRGWFGLIGLPFGSTDSSWPESEYQFALLKLKFDSNQIESIAGREDAGKRINEHWEGAKENIRRWAEENQAERIAVIDCTLWGKNPTKTTGCTLYRVVQTHDGLREYAINDESAKHLRVWHHPDTVTHFLRDSSLTVERNAFIQPNDWAVEDGKISYRHVMRKPFFEGESYSGGKWDTRQAKGNKV